MDCKSIVKHLSDFLNGTLDATHYASIERHLENCTDCRLVVNTTQKTIQIFCNAEPAPLPQDIRQKLHEALEKRLRRTGD